MITGAIIFITGIIVGALVTRKHLDSVNKIVAEAKELAEKVDSKIDQLNKPKTRGRKPAVKKK